MTAIFVLDDNTAGDVSSKKARRCTSTGLDKSYFLQLLIADHVELLDCDLIFKCGLKAKSGQVRVSAYGQDCKEHQAIYYRNPILFRRRYHQ